MQSKRSNVEKFDQIGVTEYLRKIGVTEYLRKIGVTEYFRKIGVTEYLRKIGVTEYLRKIGVTEYLRWTGLQSSASRLQNSYNKTRRAVSSTQSTNPVNASLQTLSPHTRVQPRQLRSPARWIERLNLGSNSSVCCS
ncbi:hypothetical protein RRG08_029166 [Elysia crispata]|uniref:Uncharacterized protein n=1 Tax=Elysia crispata TaxID=231223 RepID=A0AAE1AL67_9GAST|nr:hypothetical protein RRG08_029166 [Elysia crispata]